jgi:hypothetical protein
MCGMWWKVVTKPLVARIENLLAESTDGHSCESQNDR